MRIVKRKRKINVKNCYLLIVTMIAFVSLLGNFFQDRYYNEALDVQEAIIEQYDIDIALLD